MTKKIILFFLLFCIVTYSIAQNNSFTYKYLPLEYSNRLYWHYAIPEKLINNAINITSYLPNGYDKSGNTDYTKQIQRAIDENQILLLPNFSILTTGIFLNTNNVLIFNRSSKLILKSTDKERYQIIALHGVDNVKIYNPVLEGDRLNHIGNTGEWGFGIDIRGSKNIELYNPKVSNCWGDGIIISKSYNGISQKKNKLFVTKNISIYNAYLDYNRRNGITIGGGVVNLYVYNPVVLNTNGTQPMAGICIEPDKEISQNKLNNIFIYNPLTYNNTLGVLIALGNFISNEIKYTNIFIQNFTDLYSEHALAFAEFKSSYSERVKPLKGRITINNAIFIENKQKSILRGHSYNFSQNIKISNVIIIKNGAKLDSKDDILKNIKDKTRFYVK